jgi:hypothetical protein
VKLDSPFKLREPVIISFVRRIVVKDDMDLLVLRLIGQRLVHGKWIAYRVRSGIGLPGARIFIVPASGGQPRQLAANFESFGDPVWSEDMRAQGVRFIGSADWTGEFLYTMGFPTAA